MKRIHRWQAPTLWGVITLIALCVAGCGATTAHTARATPTATPAATPAPKLPSLGWVAVNLPDNLNPLETGITVSPIDGHFAWICVPSGTHGFDIWATRDAGASWRVEGHFSQVTPEQASCNLVADEIDPHALAAQLTWGSGEAGTLGVMSLYSSDDAAHWVSQPAQVNITGSVATVNSTVIAVVYAGLAISQDGFRSWRITRPSGLADNALFQFWMAPTGGTLLAASQDNTLWRTDDLGGHWTRVPTPNVQVTSATWLSASKRFFLCGGVSGTMSGPTSADVLMSCSVDLGSHWTLIPLLDETTTCSKCGLGVTTQSVACNPVIAPDGSLLAACPSAFTTFGASSFILYRLAPGASSWTVFGGSPGVVWSVPANGLIWARPTDASASVQVFTLQLPL